MRDHKIEATYSSSQRPDFIRDWFRRDYVSDSNRRIQHRDLTRMRRISGRAGNSWIDCNRTWQSYRIAATIIYCGLFGADIGLILTNLVGVR